MANPRIATYSASGKTAYGAVTDKGVIDLSSRFGKDYPTLREVIAAGALTKLAEEAERSSPDVALDAITYLPPIPLGAGAWLVWRRFPSLSSAASDAAAGRAGESRR